MFYSELLGKGYESFGIRTRERRRTKDQSRSFLFS